MDNFVLRLIPVALSARSSRRVFPPRRTMERASRLKAEARTTQGPWPFLPSPLASALPPSLCVEEEVSSHPPLINSFQLSKLSWRDEEDAADARGDEVRSRATSPSWCAPHGALRSVFRRITGETICATGCFDRPMIKLTSS